MSVFSNIVCCISLSENPDDVAQYTNDITRQNDAKLILVHVAADNESILRRTGSKSMVEKLIDESRKANEEAFTEYVNKHFAGLDTTIVLTEGRVEEELLKSAEACLHSVLPAMEELRHWADRLENMVADDLWPLPSYQEMLFMK